MEQGIKEPRLEDLRRVLTGEGQIYEAWVWRIEGTDISHHPSEPAIQYKNGSWIWAWIDQKHRWDGPAQYKDGKYEYWIHGFRLTEEEWLRDPQRIKWLKMNKLGGL